MSSLLWLTHVDFIISVYVSEFVYTVVSEQRRASDTAGLESHKLGRESTLILLAW